MSKSNYVVQMNDAAPLLVTLKIDATAQAHFDALRRQYFPPERNYLAAHLTLFHQLPQSQEILVREVLQQTATQTQRFTMQTSGVMFMGYGSAYLIASPELIQIRKHLATSFTEWLIPQDANQKFNPHITVQNKVEPQTARLLHTQLQEEFQSCTLTAIGFDLWLYRGGPWRHVTTFSFNDK